VTLGGSQRHGGRSARAPRVLMEGRASMETRGEGEEKDREGGCNPWTCRIHVRWMRVHGTGAYLKERLATVQYEPAAGAPVRQRAGAWFGGSACPARSRRS
jgi:hypothetical protein